MGISEIIKINMRLFKILLFLIFIGCVQTSLAQTVYITKTGEKYHTENCRYLKYSKKEIILEQAINLGYKACSICDPVSSSGEIESLISEPTEKTYTDEPSSQKATASQCTGKTKAGNRCKRMTKNASGRCYQH